MIQQHRGSAPFSFLKNSGLLFFVFALCFVFWLGDLWRPFNSQKGETNFVWEMFGYYSYLPATFLNDGSFVFGENVVNFNAALPNGEFMPKYTYGVALLQLPFFLLALLVSKLQDTVGNGFTHNFAIFQEYGAVLYVLLGLFLLRKVLIQYYKEFSVTIVMFLALFGTVLFMYTFVQAEMSHSYLFFLFCVFIYFSWRYYTSLAFVFVLPAAFSWALIALIRPTEIVLLLFFILWGVRNLTELKQRLWSFLKNLKVPLTFIAALALVWIPQLVFWKQTCGTFFYDSYPNEKFFWWDPQIANVLFSYRKGLFIYTPALLLAVVGMFLVKKNSPFSPWLFTAVFFSLTYIYSCWWSWDFGGSFGARSFTHHVVYLMFPMTALVDRIFSTEKSFVLQRFATLVLVVFIFSAVSLNLGQSYQYQVQRKIHPSNMSSELYWMTFRKYQYSDHFNNYLFWKFLRDDKAADWRKGLNRKDAL